MAKRINRNSDLFLRMKKATRYLTENEMMGGERPYDMYDNGHEEMADCSQFDGQCEMDGGEPDPTDALTSIRDAAMNGLQQFANDVDSEIYQFFKKIWLMCDKLVSNNESGDKPSGAEK